MVVLERIELSSYDYQSHALAIVLQDISDDPTGFSLINTHMGCINCNKPLERGQSKYCSLSCSATHGNKTGVRNYQKQSDTLKRKGIKPPATISDFPYSYVYFNICTFCNTAFYVKEWRHKKRKTCSQTCLSARKKQSGSVGGRISASKQVKRSKDEIKLFNLCLNHFNNVRHNEEILQGWDADIILDDYKIAILWNGPWHYQELDISNHSLIQVQTRDRIKLQIFEEHGWKTLVYEDRNHTPESAFSEIQSFIGGRCG